MYFRDSEYLSQCIQLYLKRVLIICFYFILIHDLYGFLKDILVLYKEGKPKELKREITPLKTELNG